MLFGGAGEEGGQSGSLKQSTHAYFVVCKDAGRVKYLRWSSTIVGNRKQLYFL